MNRSVQGDRVKKKKRAVNWKREIERDAVLRKSIDTLETTCGVWVRRLIESGRTTLTPAKIKTISRKYRDAQREEMDSYRQTGRPPRRRLYRDVVAEAFPKLIVCNCNQSSLEGISDVPAIDTHDLKEVYTRLGRADGLLAKSLIDWVRRGLSSSTEEKERLKKMVQSIARTLPLLAKALGLSASLPGLEKQGGTYVVVMRLLTTLEVEAGGLGNIKLPPGYYTYIGTAFGAGGLQARVGRHCNRDTPQKWHIDYVKPAMQVLEVWYTYDPEKRERLWAKVVSRMPGAEMPVEGFGSADFVRDRAGARAHFFRFEDLPDLGTFRRMVSDEVPKHPAVSRLAIEAQQELT